MYPGKVVRLVVAQENGGMEGPWVGPATAENLPLVANRLDTKKDEGQRKKESFSFYLLVNFISNAPYPW